MSLSLMVDNAAMSLSCSLMLAPTRCRRAGGDAVGVWREKQNAHKARAHMAASAQAATHLGLKLRTEDKGLPS
jgi:hypothetical protein